MRKITALFFYFVIICLFFTGLTPARAQSISCQTPQEKAKCQAQYDELQKEIAQWQKVLDDTQAKKKTLTGDVTILNAQIAQAQSEIKKRGITISTLTTEINQKAAVVTALQARIENDKNLLANLLKKKDQNEVQPIFYLLLSADDLSNMIVDVDNVATINQGLQDLFAELDSTKTETQKAQDDLSAKKNQELDAQYVVEQKKKVIAENQVQKKQLLDATAQAESNYQKVLADRQRQAEVIKSALFNLRDTQGISFDQALNFANLAANKTSVRPAFILAILSQESDLGKNIGSCYVSDLNSGDGVGKNTGTPFKGVMKAPRDTVPFQNITDSLGLAWATTPVSCPIAGGGYGGAMGPSQFIPSTWQMFASRIGSALGVATPNPWDPKAAIMATSLYLSDLGAVTGSYTSELNAACKYYSGRACDNKKPYNTFYANSVIAKAEKFQNDIDFLKSI